VAYSSLAHLGFIVLGTFALTTQAVTGSVIQMVNHGLIIALLFIVISWIYERRGTWQASELRGLQRPAPILAAVFMLALLATIGLPGLNDFVGEFLILVGTFVTHRWWAVVATGGVVLAAIYMLWAYQQAFHHEPDAANANTPDISWREGAVVAPLVVLIIFLGVYPKPVLDRITPSVNLLDPPRRPGHREAGRVERRPFVPCPAGVVDPVVEGSDRRPPGPHGGGPEGDGNGSGHAAVGVAHVVSAPVVAAPVPSAPAATAEGTVVRASCGRLT
jgi:formate hydrogenlyase subunit 3/multisubunit Na+/H+ antiporter MnhD subunit